MFQFINPKKVLRTPESILNFKSTWNWPDVTWCHLAWPRHDLDKVKGCNLT